ncbi:hypothetical protein ACFLZ0_00505 [Patescibacteria group bacterium]
MEEQKRFERFTKNIITKSGKKIVKTRPCDSLWFFLAGDIITSDIEGSNYRKKIKVEGFNNKLWGRIEGEEEAFSVSSPKGLILLERPGLKFKVGDKVSVKLRDGVDKVGKIIVINPNISTCFLIQVGGWKKGHINSFFYKGISWFPEKYMKVLKDCIWRSERQIDFVKK